MNDIPEGERFEKYVLPFFIYFRSFADIIVRVFEIITKSKSGSKFLFDALNFSKNEHEKNEYLYKGRNKELDALFKDQDLFKLLKP